MITNLFYIFWILQIILESLPISSSGHLILISNFFDKKNLDFLNLEYLNHLMHIPTFVILVIFILMQWGYLLVNFSLHYNYIIKLFCCILLSDITTGLIYLFLNYFNLRFNAFLPFGFLLTGLALGSLYFLPNYNNLLQITYFKALVLGLIQGIALMPGISRLGVTFVAGCWLGLLPGYAFVYSCAIQLPLIFVAISKSFYLFRLKFYEFFNFSGLQIFLIFLISCFSFILLKYIFYLSSNLNIKVLSWYMIIPALLALVF